VLKVQQHKIINDENSVIISKTVKFISQDNSYKYLEFWINLDLNWHKQQNESEVKIRKMLDLISFKKMSIDQKITLINIVLHNSIEYRMNVIAFPNGWLEKMDNIIVSRILKLLGLPVNKPNKDAIWYIKGLHKLETLQIALYCTTMIDRVLNSPSTLVNKSTIDILAIKAKLKSVGGELIDTHSSFFDPLDVLEKNKGIGLANKLQKLGISTSQDITSDGTIRPLNEVRQLFSEIKYRVSESEWNRVTKIINTYQESLPFPEQILPVTKEWNLEKLSPSQKKRDLISVHNEICVWTDGSLKNNKAEAGIFLSKKWKKSLRVEGEQSILNAELQAIEWALVNIPSNWHVKFITDSKNSISAINKFSSLHYNKRIKCENFDTLCRIVQLSDQRLLAGGNLSFIHIYSHPEEKIKQAKGVSHKEGIK
jgi:hypothetical protein